MEPNDLHPLYQPQQGALKEIEFACLSVADEAHLHKPQPRRKADISEPLPYITHPIATVNILDLVGEESPVIKGAAYLHDVCEDCTDYLEKIVSTHKVNSSPPYIAALKFRLAQELARTSPELNGKTDIDRIGHFVRELTGPSELPKEQKRIERALSAMNYSHEAALIKIADLNASLACDIIHPPARSLQEQIDYINYAWAVAKAAAHVSDGKAGNVRDGKIRDLFKLTRYLHDVHCQLLDVKEPDMFEPEKEVIGLSDAEKEKIRKNFDLNKAWKKAKTLPNWPKGKGAQDYVIHPRLADLEKGISQIGLTEDGQVSRLCIVFEKGSDNMLDHYQFANKLTNAIEQAYTDNAVGYGSLYKERKTGKGQLKLKLREPIPLEQFLLLAGFKGVLDTQHNQDFIDLVKERAKPQPTVGASEAALNGTALPLAPITRG